MQKQSTKPFPRIKCVRAYASGGACDTSTTSQAADCHDVDDSHWINGTDTPIANPMSSYPQYANSRKSWGINALGSLVVEVEADDGTTVRLVFRSLLSLPQNDDKIYDLRINATLHFHFHDTQGVGITIGGDPGAYIVEHHLSRFVEGQDPRAVELIWDQMFRATINYGRKGLPIQAISAVDLAIWDLLGKLRNEPVYALLGGKAWDRLPVYMTSSNPLNAKKMGKYVLCRFPRLFQSRTKMFSRNSDCSQ